MALSNTDKKEIEVIVRKEIKDFLNIDQMPYFEEFIRETTDRILLGRKKNTPPPKDFK